MDVNATSMKLKFPEFGALPDAQIEFAIEEAARGVDETWIEKDINLAQMYLAAHYLALAVARSEPTGQQVVSEKIGEISVTYAQAQKTPGDIGDYSSTVYGTRFSELMQLNFPAVAII